jgi:signal peptide peptidase SppA
MTMSRNLERLRSAVFAECWAILPEKLEAIIGVIEASTAEDCAAAAKAMANPAAKLTVIDGVPVIPVLGVIAKRMNLFHAISGGTSIEAIDRMFDEAMAMDAPGIVLNIESPGGAVSGTPEFAAKIRAAAESSDKVIVAYADSLAASGAYWIGSQANVFMASSAAEVGSIGVIASITDPTRAMRNAGYDETIIRSSELKAPGAGPITPRQQSSIQAKVQTYYAMFKDAVVAGRPDLDIESVATGETWIGKDAIAAGLVDSLGSLMDAVATVRKNDH